MGDVVNLGTAEERAALDLINELDEVITGPDYAFTRSALSEALDSILEDPSDWKGPIDAVIPNNRLRICMVACEFFTGTTLDVYHLDKDWTQVRSVGYRAGPCGDH